MASPCCVFVDTCCLEKAYDLPPDRGDRVIILLIYFSTIL